MSKVETNPEQNTSLARTSEADLNSAQSVKVEDRLMFRLTEILAALGYELVHVEVQTHRQMILRLFIDKPGGIGIEDCALVSKALDQPLEQLPEVTELFKSGAYELEVSSPGVDRPLRKEQDFMRFKGRRIRLNTFRPLAAEELENNSYASLNPRQKNFLGELLGFNSGKVHMRSNIGNAEIKIPLALVAKANLDPDFDFSDQEQTDSKSRQKRN
ncbi:MAG: ribosome maturation factor RimP [Bdellovibrionales bacterium]|nr:ribosome maturation factor RimP [Bdellovibrionales bacterium]